MSMSVSGRTVGLLELTFVAVTRPTHHRMDNLEL